MKTAREQAEVIGQYGLLHVKGLRVKVRIVDVKCVPFRPDRYLVQPVDGTGGEWVNATQVEMTTPPIERDFEDMEVSYA